MNISGKKLFIGTEREEVTRNMWREMWKSFAEKIPWRESNHRNGYDVAFGGKIHISYIDAIFPLAAAADDVTLEAFRQWSGVSGIFRYWFLLFGWHIWRQECPDRWLVKQMSPWRILACWLVNRDCYTFPTVFYRADNRSWRPCYSLVAADTDEQWANGRAASQGPFCGLLRGGRGRGNIRGGKYTRV